MATLAPLAHRLRPTSLDDFVGQEAIVGPESPLRRAIEEDRLSSVILAGPPGTGKTTLAKIIAEKTAAEFVSVNAVTSGSKELKRICDEAERAQLAFGERTVLFVDEIHRFNTAQQDALLPAVESGSVILIGATTQNPYFDVNAALVSRSHVYLLQPLTVDDLTTILRRALVHPEGYGGRRLVSDDALEHIAKRSNGDARVALNLLELTLLAISKNVDAAAAQKIVTEQHKRYDSKGEDHYNSISAFIKTMRGSDPDAALVWLFRMLQSGEDPRFLFRRMAILASEDVGNADPHALPFVVAAWQAFELVGYPEGEYFLAHACVYLSQAPKSNAVTKAMGAVKRALKEAPTLEVPNHLRNAPLKGMAEQGYGAEYQYPHNAPEGVVKANYFPVGMKPQNFYEPTQRGFESDVRERMEKAKNILRSV